MAIRHRARAVAGTLATAVVLAACGCSVAGSPTGGTAAQGKVIALTKMSELRNLFNRDQGHARLVMIFSPT